MRPDEADYQAWQAQQQAESLERRLEGSDAVAQAMTQDNEALQARIQELEAEAQGHAERCAAAEAERDDAKARAERLVTELRKRVIFEYFTGTAKNEVPWLACRVCGWAWQGGSTENHEDGCPAALRADAEGVQDGD